MEVWYSFNIFCFGFLTTQFLFAVSQEMFTIIRNPGGGNQWTDLDEFKLPDSKCDVHCSVWNPYSVAQDYCHCKCSYNREATFGFYSGSWKCLDNTEVRRQAGCKYEFSSVPHSTYPPKIINEGEQHNTILPSSGCSVNQAKSRYFRCDGRWAGIDSQSFSIQYIRRLSMNNDEYRVIIGSGISAALSGRIISLNITCPQESSCLLFKLQGEFRCAENVTSLKTSPSSAIPSPTTTPATATAAATSDPHTTAANLNDKGNKEKAKSSGSSSTLVGVVVTLVILVVIAIVIAFYVYRKRKRGESIWLVDYISKVRNIRSKQPTAKETQEDPEYAEIPEERRRNEPVNQPESVYSYAFDDPQTAYTEPQQAPYNRLVHNPRGPEEEGAIYSTTDDGSVYNVLERLPAENQIMMAPKSTINEEPLSQDFEPEYQVLEGPDTTEETTDPLFINDVRASVGPANPGGLQTGPVASKERRRPPSPPRKR